MSELENKLQTYFPKMVVYKGEGGSSFSSCNIPNYIKDWFLMRYADKNGKIDPAFLSDKLFSIVPRKSEWIHLFEKMMNDNEEIKFLTKIKIKLSISTNEITFALPDLDVDYKDTIIDKLDWDNIRGKVNIGDEEAWGIVTLKYVPYKKGFRIALTNFSSFRPYQIKLDYYIENRKQFDIDEWINVLLGAMNYNGENYETLDNKLSMLKRLLPFVEKRLNLIELAPKGTGKSYVYSQISKFGWLNSGGVMSRAKLFYDMHSKTVGLLGNYDYVALDEISTIRFTDIAEMQGSLKGYLESGTFAVGTKMNSSEAGMVFIGNIKSSNMNVAVNMFKDLPALFNDSALLDRIHGFVEGWKIPRMDESLKQHGWALNTEYFSEVLHLLREETLYMGLVDSLIDNVGGDTRDITAVKRLTSGFMKLLFPHWRNVEDVDLEQFKTYCLNPSIEMRNIIKSQLILMDEEYKSKPFPEFIIKETL